MRKGKQPQEIDKQVWRMSYPHILNGFLTSCLWVALMNVVEMGFSGPGAEGPPLDMIFSVAFACTQCALTTMAHLSEPVNMCPGP